jgi:ribosome biogenesis SPOUT family RNA methylase Rps3
MRDTRHPEASEKGELAVEYKSRNGDVMRNVLIIIEHLEPVLGKWIWLEYKHISNMVGYQNLLFANVRRRNEASKLRGIGRVTRKSTVILQKRQDQPMIVLDPQSPNPLSHSDFSDSTCLIIGGILGDHPAGGRTKLALTDRMPSIPSRNLGQYQFSVDGAVHMAMEIVSGKSIGDIPVKIGVEIKVNKRHSCYLPFAYPLVRGKPLLAPGLAKYLRQGVFTDEEILFKTGIAPSVA